MSMPVHTARMSVRDAAIELRSKVLANVLKQNPSPEGAIKYLHPMYGAAILGYKYVERPSLDQQLHPFGTAESRRQSETAGLLDRENRIIAVSAKFSLEERRFTGGHELGHVVRHPDLKGVHRDRPINTQLIRGPLEFEADLFSAEYLMPDGWVRSTVKRLFSSSPIRLNSELAWWLDPTDPERLLDSAPRNELNVALAVAKCTRTWNGVFPSLHAQFAVSPTAMALRLMELHLVDS